MPTTYEPDTYYRFSPFAKRWIATSGVMNHCQLHRCFWVLDNLASYVAELAKKKHVDYFLIVHVEVNPDKTAVFTIQQEARHDEGYITLVRQVLDYTDLKESWTFWAINESSGNYDPACQTVVLLPDEY